MISAGMLTTPIEVLEPSVQVSDYGEERALWKDVFCRTRCSILRRTGKRAEVLGEVSESASREIIIRYREGIHFRQRIRFPRESTTYFIQNITPSRSDGSITLSLSLINE